MRFNFPAGVSAVALLLGSCTSTSGPLDEAEIRDHFHRYNDAFSAGDAEAVSAFYAADVVRIPPGEAVEIGLEAVAAGLSTFFAENDYVLDEVITEDIRGTGSLAVVRGTFREHWTPREGGVTTVQSGRWLTVWERQAEGRWKITREMWNLEQAAPGEGQALLSHHLLNLPEGVSEAQLAEVLAEFNTAVAEAGYPTSGYRLWRVAGDQSGGYAYLWVGYWPDQAAYDDIHEHPAYRAAAERWGSFYETLAPTQAYDRYVEVPLGAASGG